MDPFAKRAVLCRQAVCFAVAVSETPIRARKLRATVPREVATVFC